MHFLPDVWVECEVCRGARYNPETLAVKYKGKSISDVLNMRVSEALEVFGNIPKIRVVLQTLSDVGLDYISLGQSAPTLSGGEAQRVKLAAELARPSTGKTLYLLDEPTTGLHFDDVRKLLEVLHRLVDLGNTVITVEHNLEVIKTADWVIDMGPEAGVGGGQVVAFGTPEEVVARAKAAKANGGPTSYTGQILDGVLKAGPHAVRAKFDPMAAVARREGDIELEKVGKDAQLPWQTDGKRWHCVDRLTMKGTPCRWEGDILPWIDGQIRSLGTFSDTDWSERTVVEIAAPKKSQGWFFHAHTSMEWLLRLVFRVGRNTFKQEALSKQLGLKPLDEMKLPVYGREDRVKVANRKGPWQEVWMLVHNQAEIDTPAFKAFLKQAVAAFEKNLGRMTSSPEDVMPWKVNGEKWHLSDKGFPPGRKMYWDRGILPAFLAIVKESVAGLEIQWDARDGITLRLPGFSKGWGRVRTKDNTALIAHFLGKPGQLNLSRLEGIGKDSALAADRADGGEVMKLLFHRAEEMPRAKLKALLAEHATGFREQFGE
jgi:excinuclease ABC subunit A